MIFTATNCMHDMYVSVQNVLNMVEGGEKRFGTYTEKVRNSILEMYHLGNMNISCKCHTSP